MTDIEIVEATTPAEINAVAALFRDYLLWMRRIYARTPSAIDEHFEEKEWESELADLTGHYGSPYGAIILALVDGVPAGCVVARGISEDVAEMRRLFVRPAFRGLGLGRCMTQRLAQVAAARGYTTVRLETGPLQPAAHRIYQEMGFARIAPYYEVSGWFKDRMLFFEGKTHDIASHPCPDRQRFPVAA